MTDALNTQQVDTGGSNILDEIGNALSQMFGGSMGGQTPEGYEWDALQGWVPKAGAQPPAAPAAAPAPAPKAPEPWHAPMTGAPAYSGPPVPEPAPHAPMANMPPYTGPMPKTKPLVGALGQKPRTVIPTQEMGGSQAPIGPNPNMFQK